jgi:hypothetical protein
VLHRYDHCRADICISILEIIHFLIMQPMCRYLRIIQLLVGLKLDSPDVEHDHEMMVNTCARIWAREG